MLATTQTELVNIEELLDLLTIAVGKISEDIEVEESYSKHRKITFASKHDENWLQKISLKIKEYFREKKFNITHPEKDHGMLTFERDGLQLFSVTITVVTTTSPQISITQWGFEKN